MITFAVAGHIYGDPNNYTHAVYPPFLEAIKQDQKKHPFDFLFLTGDLIKDSTQNSWKTTSSQIDSLNIPWFVAPGNHDMEAAIYSHDMPPGQHGMRGDYTYTQKKQARFYVLNTTNPGWTLTDLHKESLKSALAEIDPDSVKQLFVFTHQLWWQRNRPRNIELDTVRPNSFNQLEGSSDFWADVFPYFDSTGIETWFFAGDLGADTLIPSYYEDHYTHFHFYASGMGCGTHDNYLIVRVYEDGRVDIERRDF